MNKYKLHWIEAWDEDSFCSRIIANYPWIHVTGNYGSDIEVEIIDKFEAENDKDAWNYAVNNYDLDVFSLYRIKDDDIQIGNEDGLFE